MSDEKTTLPTCHECGKPVWRCVCPWTVQDEKRAAPIGARQEEQPDAYNEAARVMAEKKRTERERRIVKLAKREKWLAELQEFLEARIADAPDETCRFLASNMWDRTAELTDDD